jgi:hypothetical protein
MLEKLEALPPGIHGVRAVGKVSKKDYEQVLDPLVDKARRNGPRLRLLYQLGPEFEGFTPGGAWADGRVGLRALSVTDGCALVSDVGWVRSAAEAVGFLAPCPFRVFPNRQRADAIEWLSSLPETPEVSARLVPESGVAVIEVGRALRAEDFDAVARKVDPWINAYGELQGVVIHARRFPGWQTFGSFLRHVQFVRDHQRKIHRVALVAGGKLAQRVPAWAQQWVKPEVKSFPYDQLERAMVWAAGPAEAAAPEIQPVAAAPRRAAPS